MINRAHNRIRKLKLDEYHWVEMTFDEKLRREYEKERLNTLYGKFGQ